MDLRNLPFDTQVCPIQIVSRLTIGQVGVKFISSEELFVLNPILSELPTLC